MLYVSISTSTSHTLWTLPPSGKLILPLVFPDLDANGAEADAAAAATGADTVAAADANANAAATALVNPEVQVLRCVSIVCVNTILHTIVNYFTSYSCAKFMTKIIAASFPSYRDYLLHLTCVHTSMYQFT